MTWNGNFDSVNPVNYFINLAAIQLALTYNYTTDLAGWLRYRSFETRLKTGEKDA
jgi:hypothetical protein